MVQSDDDNAANAAGNLQTGWLAAQPPLACLRLACAVVPGGASKKQRGFSETALENSQDESCHGSLPVNVWTNMFKKDKADVL